MASSGLNFAKLTPDNGAVRDLRELIYLSITRPDKLGALFNFMPGQADGKKVGLIGQFGLLGKPSTGCTPSYGNDLAAAAEKTWDIKEWEIAEQICYTDLAATLAKIALKKGTQVADLTGTDYMDNVLMPLLEEAVARTVLRLAFFGDKAASTYNSGSNTSGTIKAGVSADYFKVTDGIWKHIFDAVAKGTGNDGYITRVAIEANSKTSIALQKEAMKGTGVASGILDDLIASAPMQLRQAPGQVIYLTQAFADALSADIRNNNKGSDLQWKSIFTGVTEAQYNGVTIQAVAFQDEIIQGYLQNTTNAAAYDKPYRALYTIKDNLLVGSESQSEIADIDAWFDKTAQKNYILCRDTLGTLVVDEKLTAVAY